MYLFLRWPCKKNNAYFNPNICYQTLQVFFAKCQTKPIQVPLEIDRTCMIQRIYYI